MATHRRDLRLVARAVIVLAGNDHGDSREREGEDERSRAGAVLPGVDESREFVHDLRDSRLLRRVECRGGGTAIGSSECSARSHGTCGTP